MLIPLLRSHDHETVTASVAALRNLSIHKGNEVIKPGMFGKREERSNKLGYSLMPRI